MMRAEVERNADRIRPELCPSIAELLAALHADGKLLGVVTGNLERIGWAKLEHAGIRKYFDFGSFSDQREKREDIFRHGAEQARRLRGSATSVCFIGDTPADIRAAASVGLPVIAVATGIYSREQLAEHGPPLCVQQRGRVAIETSSQRRTGRLLPLANPTHSKPRNEWGAPGNPCAQKFIPVRGMCSSRLTSEYTGDLQRQPQPDPTRA